VVLRMARDLEQRFKDAEKLFKQGRAPVAVRDLRQIAEESGREPLILNRVGDVLARNNHAKDAIVYFDKIADDLSKAGFFPKAIAVLKKTLRIAPDHVPALLLLGEVYARQDVLSEARGHLLRAGERFLKARNVAGTLAIFEKLAEIDPADPLHLVRVAEAKAMTGDKEGATSRLLAAADLLLRAGRAGEAEKTFRRALEMAPARSEATAGIARCLVAQSRGQEAVDLLESAAARPEARKVLLGDLAWVYERLGRTQLVVSLLSGADADHLPDSAFADIVRVHAEQGDASEGWARIAPALARFTAAGRFDRLVPLLEHIGSLDDQELPALERLRDARRAAGGKDGLAAVLERLVRAYWAKSAHALASAALEELKQIAPASPLVAESLARRSVSSQAAAVKATPTPSLGRTAPASPPAPAAPAPESAEARSRMAVPETHADREFVSSRMIEAEAFQKYNLLDSAEQQLREVARRFPGFADVHQRLAAVLRARKDVPGLQSTMVDLALARAAAGDAAGAQEAAKQAASERALPDELRVVLTRGGVFPSAATGSQRPAPAAQRPAAPKVGPRPVAPAAPAPRATAPDEPEIEIVFGDDEAEGAEAPEGLLTSPTGEPGMRMPPADALDEVAFFLDQGMRAEAVERIATLRKTGFGGEKLDALERRVAMGGGARRNAPPPVAQRQQDDTDLFEIVEEIDGDLAREAEPGYGGAQPEAGEQSVEDVFSAFKDQVADQIGLDDHRAHYDLAIAYKEMGLLDDALREFEAALPSPDLHREACSMLALCHREQGDSAQAARWYRQAVEAASPESPDLMGLRYDLADVLAELGEDQEALSLFRAVHAADPGYRDVALRLSNLSQRTRP